MKSMVLVVLALIFVSPSISLGHSGVPEATTGFGQPMESYNYSGYHFNEWSGKSGCYHPGADYNWPGTSGDDDLGKDILAVAAGLVVDVFSDPDFGLCIGIEHYYQGVTVYSQYAHLGSSLVSEGQTVLKGQHIAELGNSGTGAGTNNAHLHWEIREADHPSPHMANYWNTQNFQSQSNINDWYEDPEAWCNNHPAYDTYSCTWHTQSPTSSIVLNPGATFSFVISYENTGNVTWHNTGGTGSEDYVELRSCISSGAQANSWLYPGDGLWVTNDHQRVVAQGAANVAHGQNAWFSFTGKVPTDATAQLYNIYFRPYHGNTPLTGWTNAHPIQVQVVVQPPAPSVVKIPFAGRFNTDGAVDIGLYDATHGDWFVAMSTGTSFTASTSGWLGTWGASATAFTRLSGDFNADGKTDIGLYEQAYGRWYVALNQGATFVQSGVYWKDNWGTSSTGAFAALTGDYNGDGYADVCLYTASDGAWFVALSNGAAFTPASYAWLPSWGASSVFIPLAGDFTGDGKTDVALYDPVHGDWFVAVSTGSGFTPAAYGWLGGWGISSPPYKPLVGDFNGDGKMDVGLFDPVHGDWFVATSTGSGFAASEFGWLPGWGASSTNLAFAGDFTGDSKADVCLYDPVHGDWFVAVSNGTTFTPSPFGWLGNWGAGKVAHTTQYSLPQTPALHQNYPNPFNPVTTISYALPAATHVTLEVFNILGQRVITIVDGEQTAGEHIATWDASSNASGVYLYRLQTDAAVATKKMLLLK